MSILQLHGILQAHEAFASSSPLDSLQKDWVPLFHSGVLLSKKRWLGYLVFWIWRVASFLHIADERSSLQKIIDKAHLFFTAARDRGSSVEAKSFQKLFIAYSSCPEYADKVTSLACSFLHCTDRDWQQTLKQMRTSFFLELFDELALFPIVPNGSKEEDELWVKEIQEVFPFIEASLFWDVLESLCVREWAENGRDGSQHVDGCGQPEKTAVFIRSVRKLFALYEAGLRLLDHAPVAFEEGALESFTPPDPHFRCFPSGSSDTILLVAENSFCIPLWRAYAEKETVLFPLIACCSPDQSKRKAFLEGIIGKVKDLLPQNKELVRTLCPFLRFWMESRLSFDPNGDDLWLSFKGEIVTFAPCRVHERPYSLLHVEEFLHVLLPQKDLRQSVFESIGFFQQKEIVVLENLFLRKGIFCSEERIRRELAFHGIQDPYLFQRTVLLLSQLQKDFPQADHERGKEVMRSYIKRAHSEGFFFTAPN